MATANATAKHAHTADILQFPTERASLMREFGDFFPESSQLERQSFANLVQSGVEKHLIIEGRRLRMQREEEGFPKYDSENYVEEILEFLSSRRAARRQNRAHSPGAKADELDVDI